MKIKNVLLGDLQVVFDCDLKKYVLSSSRLPHFRNGYVYFQSASQSITEKQRNLYQDIRDDFDNTMQAAFRFLIDDHKYLTEHMKGQYPVESVTIFDNSNEPAANWALDLRNLKDGFRIL